MAKYRLVDDIDLTFNRSEPRDAHGRWVARGHAPAAVSLKDAAYVVNGRSFDGGGHALKAAAPASGGGIVAFMQKVQPKAPATPFNTFSTLGGKPSLKPVNAPKKAAEDVAGDRDIEAAVKQAATLSDGDIAGAVDFWKKHKPSADDADSDNLATDLGVNPRYKERSVKELRRAIKSRTTDAAERVELKAELAKRVTIAKAVADEKGRFTNRLTKRLEDAPEGADIAPIIGETLAQHPRLGPLAHIYDRLRLMGYNFKKSVTSKEAGDELPRIIARNVASVLVALLAIHFGVMIPGLGGGGG